ncbi:MAG: beta-propeller domain-containing protein [Nitrososphaeria archaeon]|nr:beta-propeller domain-containing protein [Nitrososphaeria archaeon]
MFKRKLLASSIILALVLVSTYTIYHQYYIDDSVKAYGLKKFSSYSELKTFIKNNVELSKTWFGIYGFPVSIGVRDVLTGMVPVAASTAEASPKYSQTNIQVAGVDEPDIVKTDGSYIYYVRSGTSYNSGVNELVIVKAYPPEDLKVASKIVWTDNSVPIGIFVNKNRLTVFLSNSNVKAAIVGRLEHYYLTATRIEVYDLIHMERVKLVRNVTLDGYYLNARMIEDYVYAVVTSPIYYIGEEIILPSMYVNGKSESIDPKEVYYADTPDIAYSFTTIIALNVFNDEEPITKKTILTGAASNMYVSLKNIYLAITKYNFVKDNIGTFSEETLVYRISVNGKDINFEAEGSVPGHVLNQFSMDEYNGYFRIATTVGYSWFRGSSETNNVYTLDMNLKVVGKLENIAKGEKIYSVRFMGDKVYMVTFKKVDPFFVIDLSDASSPKILGWLKIPGYSDYLHPLDKEHIIGIGKETVEAEEGDFAWYQGIKISLFEVKNVSAPKEVSKYIIGERGTDSPILRDHHALLFDGEKGLMAFPVLLAIIDRSQYIGEIPPYAYGEPVWQGLYVFSVSSNYIALKGRITHLNNSSEKNVMKIEYGKFIDRALYVGDYLYTLSDEIVKVNILSTLEEVNILYISK